MKSQPSFDKNTRKFLSSVRIKTNKGKFGKQLRTVLSALKKDINNGVSKQSEAYLKDLLQIMKDNAPSFTGTLKNSGRMTRVQKDGKLYGGKIVFDATQQDQYDSLSSYDRWNIYLSKPYAHDYKRATSPSAKNGNPMAGQESRTGMDILDVSWTPENPDYGYIDLIPNNGGQEWIKNSLAAFYNLTDARKNTISVLDQTLDVRKIRKALDDNLKGWGQYITASMRNNYTRQLKERGKQSRLRAAKKEVIEYRTERDSYAGARLKKITDKGKYYEQDRIILTNIVPLTDIKTKSGKSISAEQLRRKAVKLGRPVYGSNKWTYSVSKRTMWYIAKPESKTKSYRNAADRLRYYKNRNKRKKGVKK